MVGTPTTRCLLAFQNDEALRRKHHGLTKNIIACATDPLPATWILAKGLNAENRLTPPSVGKNFLLTFPFIEPAPDNIHVKLPDGSDKEVPEGTAAA